MNDRLKGIIATTLSAVMFGFLPLLVKTICEGGTNTLSCVVMRFTVALPMIWAYLKIKKISLKIALPQLGKIALLAVCGFGGTSVLLFSSYNYIPSGMSTTVHYMYPMLVTAAAVILFREKLRASKVLCVLLCAAGILLFYISDGGEALLPGQNIPLGLLLAGLSSVTYTFYTVYMDKSGLKDMEPFKLMFYLTLVSDVMVFILAACTESIDFTVAPKSWLVIIIFAVLASFVGTLGYQLGVKYIGGQAASVISTLEPVTSIIVGVLVFSESITPLSVIGCLCILSAAVIVVLCGRRTS